MTQKKNISDVNKHSVDTLSLTGLSLTISINHGSLHLESHSKHCPIFRIEMISFGFCCDLFFFTLFLIAITLASIITLVRSPSQLGQISSLLLCRKGEPVILSQALRCCRRRGFWQLIFKLGFPVLHPGALPQPLFGNVLVVTLVT